MEQKHKKIAVALSGGVDSATSAYLLQQQGYEVFGITMKVCETSETIEASKVAKLLGIKHYIVDYTEVFEREIIERFIDKYLSGETPNPCIMCNKLLKYGMLLEEVLKLGADAMALGHYGDIRHSEEDNCYHLCKGKATRKDQVYVLYHLNQEKLSKIIYPLNSFADKESVRAILKEAGLEVASKKDSVGICFTNGKTLQQFVTDRFEGRDFTGDFIDEEGNILGRHKGLFLYTIGQKRGLNLETKLPYIVKDINSETNKVVLTLNEESLYKREIKLKELSFTHPKFYGIESLTLIVKICQWGYEIPATLYQQEETTLQFDKPERAPARGQSAVFYVGDEVIGGGTIL